MTMQLNRTLEPGTAVALPVKAGWRVRISQVEGMQVADLVSITQDDRRERLSMYMSRAINHTWKLTAPHVLVGTDGRDMWTVEEDTVGENYSGGGYCNPYVNQRRYGRPDAPTCQDNLADAVSAIGLGRDSFDYDTCFNVFMRVDYNPDGAWVIAEPHCHPGDHIVLRSELDQFMALSNCPQVLNPANAHTLKRLGLEVLS